tara:strand:+ start:1673 stop:2122 length:450 start_codon:yes stop_codon:yes gene_type:complete
MITFEIKKFEEFSIQELYAVLNLRAAVFVVEQKSAYLDLDFKDQKAIHILGYVDKQLVAYSRIFKSKDYCELPSIGRVVIDKDFRENGYGNDLVQFSIKSIEKEYQEFNIHISAQLYLKNFYESHGFIALGEAYLEDELPHIAMELIKK